MVQSLIERSERDIGVRSLNAPNAEAAAMIPPPEVPYDLPPPPPEGSAKLKSTTEEALEKNAELEKKVALLTQAQQNYSEAFRRQSESADALEAEAGSQRERQQAQLANLRDLRVSLDHLETSGASDDETTTAALLQNLRHSQNETEQLVTDLRQVRARASGAASGVAQYEAEASDSLNTLRNEAKSGADPTQGPLPPEFSQLPVPATIQCGVHSGRRAHADA